MLADAGHRKGAHATPRHVGYVSSVLTRVQGCSAVTDGGTMIERCVFDAVLTAL
ncbi:hypothetical protein M407DRAFT_241742 [Tulasnella calospora MUT 4182]|uniref:Uncharacterized protein n=1 Tax=Tulasnella calospora MUT 4182 TaxID=1051891 RepID=A0A0C3QTQ7_9AGAM|nr:hypothetical protein M407DRAFT_241742 [Tulasnella calospora MUT 4182]